MKNKLNTIIIIIILILSTFTVFPIQGLKIDIEHETTDISQKIKNQGDGQTEYWALIVGVGEYAEDWDILEMCEAADELRDALIKSPSWFEDHIKVIKGKNATVYNIIRGLIWLDRMEDEDDICLIHFNTHGNSIPKDIPPKDEADGKDEILVTYWGLALPYANILDDTLNFFLSRLESKGTAVIIECCHAGGFNDPPRNKGLPTKAPKIKNNLETFEWMKNFGKELSDKGRVVIMCCEEDELGYVGTFTPYLLDAFRGFGDLNQDYIITAEEVYTYVKLRTQKHYQNPTIYDDYEGELQLLELSEKPIESIGFPVEKGLLAHPLSQENSIVCGYIKDEKTNDPLQNANISLYWTDFQGNFSINYTNSDSLGFYSLNVASGYIGLLVNLRGYYIKMIYWLNVNESEILWLNVSLTKLNESSKVCGYIRDKITNESIQNASINLDWMDGQGNYSYNYTLSNYFGFYSINVSAGYIHFTIQAEGYFNERWPEFGYYNISENETKWVNITLNPKPPETSTIKGYITDSETGEPIQNANIELYWKDDQGNSQNNDTTTNSLGFYSINVAKGLIRTNIYAEVYFHERWPESGYYNISENETKWVNISLNPKPPENSIIKGYITDSETGEPLQNANVLLDWENYQGYSQFNETFTDSEGFYFMNVAEGFIELYIEKTGYFYANWPENGYYYIAENETKWVNITLNPKPPETSTVKGYITDSETGEPIQSASVQLHWEDDQGNHDSNYTYVDSQGFYKMNVAKGSIRIFAYARNYSSYNTNWFDIDENVTIWLNITLNPYSYDYTVYGYINNSYDNSPIENASIDFYCVNPYGDHYIEFAYSDESGFYSISLQAGLIDEINVRADGFFIYRSDEDYLLDENYVLWINISLIPHPLETSKICGYITDSETTEPIENATVKLYWDEYYSELHYENTTKSDNLGFYWFDVAAGLISISASAEGYFHDSNYNVYEIDENETLWVNMSLVPHPPQNAIVCGYIRDIQTNETMEMVSVTLKWSDFDYNNYYSNYTSTDSKGFYFMNISEGKIFLRANMDGYLEEVTKLTNIYENEILWFNLSMYPSPPRNSVVCGYINDSETGEPLENVNVIIHWIGCEWHHQYFHYEECTNEKGFYSLNVPAGEIYFEAGKYRYHIKRIDRQDIAENDILWFNTSLEKMKIMVEFGKPLIAIYRNNNLKLPFLNPLIFGDIEINVYVWNCDELEKFELYIDDELKLEFVDEPNYILYSYLWTSDRIRIFGHKHTIKAVAIDKDGNSDSEEIIVWKFF